MYQQPATVIMLYTNYQLWICVPDCVLDWLLLLFGLVSFDVFSFEKANNASGKFGGVAGVFVGAAICKRKENEMSVKYCGAIYNKFTKLNIVIII